MTDLQVTQVQVVQHKAMSAPGAYLQYPDLPGTPPSGVIPTIPGRDDFALVAPVDKICPQDATRRDANEQGGVCNVSLSLFCFPGFSRDSHP